MECLPCCVTPERPAAFPPTTAGKHLLDKYAATHAGYKHGGGGGSGGGSGSSDGGGAVDGS